MAAAENEMRKVENAKLFFVSGPYLLKSLIMVLQAPRTSHRAPAPSVCLGIIDKTFIFGVPIQFTTKQHRNVTQMTNGSGAMSSLYVGGRVFAEPDTIQEVLLVVCAAVEMNLIRSYF